MFLLIIMKNHNFEYFSFKFKFPLMLNPTRNIRAMILFLIGYFIEHVIMSISLDVWSKIIKGTTIADLPTNTISV